MSSRFDYHDDYGDEDPNLVWGRWEGRVKAVMKGRPAQVAFRQMEAALLALPERRLITGAICAEDGGVCALGAWALHQGGEYSEIDLGYPQEWEGGREALRRRWLSDQDYFGDEQAVQEFGQATFGITPTLAWILAERNDEAYRDLSPERRWEAMLRWVREHIQEVSLA